MIRIVFEDFTCEDIVNISSQITDTTLEAFGRSCTQLDIMAITRCRSMTANGFARAVGYGSIRVLDLHKGPEGSLGAIDSDFFSRLAPFLCTSTGESNIPGGNVAVLNLFGQAQLTERDLCFAIKCGWFSKITSLSLNYCDVGPRFLSLLLQNCPQLECLSIKNCPEATEPVVSDFLNFISAASQDPHNRKHAFRKLYALDTAAASTTELPPGYIEFEDRWFGDEKLDISSLWDMTVFPL